MQTILAAAVSALITGAVTLAVSVINANANHSKLMQELKARDELQLYRIEQLEKKQDLHNEVITRTFKLEEHASIVDEKLKVANHRIDDLEKEAQHHE